MKRRVSFCLCLWSLIGSAVGEIVNVYVAEGQTLTLRPKFKDPVESVEWQRNRNLLAEWAGNEVTRYDNRIALNVSNAVLELVGVVATDAGTFTVSLNNVMQDEVFAVKVIKFVPEPEVHPTPLACSENLETCTLHCGGDTSGAEPVTYIWRTEPETEMPEVRNRTIDRKTSAVKSFFCIMQNPLGRKESQAFANPFYQDRPGGGLGPGGIAGVVSGTLGALCGVVVAAWFCSKRQRGLALRPSNGATGGTNLETSRPLNSNN
ncbi:uncharacterized protein LOC109510221 [Hippocampus comes]|uniref:uncharacterized protein LOC109510221 n=1 Tax=Hippocampus comes TaxID=109280 RepID=UPI00094E6893|nr:PREDICTED: uncharacterized protein LOC109510221 [Hippocampus comes]